MAAHVNPGSLGVNSRGLNFDFSLDFDTLGVDSGLDFGDLGIDPDTLLKPQFLGGFQITDLPQPLSHRHSHYPVRHRSFLRRI